MCSRIYIIDFKKQQTNQIKNQEPIEANETEEKKRISPKNWLKNKFAAAWVKIFFVTRISGNKSIIFVGLIKVFNLKNSRKDFISKMINSNCIFLTLLTFDINIRI